jgi:hypothetical protein
MPNTTQEATLAVLIAATATAVATGVIQVPPAVLHSSVTQAFLLVMALVLFAYSPVVGIAAFALFAILLFNRNVQKAMRYNRVAKSVYGADNIASEDVVTQPYTTMHTEPREYNKFQDTYEPYESPEAIGQYPIDDSRPTNADVKMDSYFYRPAEDMGDNTFIRNGPNMDEKMSSFAY